MRIEKRKAKKAKNGYTFRIKVDYVDECGIKQTYSKSGFATKKEARAHGVKIEHELQENGTLFSQCSKTFDDCFKESMDLNKTQLARTSYNIYKRVYRIHIKNEYIAKMPINKITYKVIQEHFNKCSGQSKSLVEQQRTCFNYAFKYAVRHGYIKENPMHDIIETHTDNHAETHVMTPEELDMAIDYFLDIKGRFRKYSYCIATYCGYYLGLRISEILALEKSDFDLENGFVYISKKLESHALKKSEMYITERMKTKDSRAVLPVPEPLKKILLEWFAFNPYDLVCCDDNGDVIVDSTYRFHCKKIGEKLGFRFNPHCLRHTYVTNVVSSGCDIKTASQLARHSNVQTTLNIYAHSTDEAKKDAVNAVFGKTDTKNDPNLKSMS